jgi:penicillin-insensitive murein endopeptidase
MRTPKLVLCAVLLAAGVPLALHAQQAAQSVVAEADKKAAPKKKPVPKVAKPPGIPAKTLFGAAKTPAPLAARSIGFYAKGCLAGGTALPVDGPAWQAMRLSRNRNWGHPELVSLVEKLGTEAKARDGWPGLLVGDLSQPRGGPMLSGHASHQVGLDADIWLTPMPDRRLTEQEREELSATSMLAADKVSVDRGIWKPEHVRLIKRAASYPSVERIFVHPAIKKALCEDTAKDTDRAWLSKVRPMWGHYYHFHIRIVCPPGSTNCEHQPVPASEDGCGAEVDRWIALLKRPEKPEKPGPPAPPKPGLTIDQLPGECKAVLTTAGGPAIPTSATDAPAEKAKTPVPKKSADAAKKTTEKK